jgi:hypothetical protein
MLSGAPRRCHTIALIGHANAGIMCTGSGLASGFDLEMLSRLEELFCILTLRNVAQAAELLGSKLTDTAFGYRHIFLLGCSSSNNYDVETSQYNNLSLAQRLAELLSPAIVYGFDDEVVQIEQLHPLTHLAEISAKAVAEGTVGKRCTIKISCSKSGHKKDRFLSKKTKMPQVSLDYFKYG